jgi:flavin reductase (DIM6/NTAB) family NADH-FMN oxidoreductase RutF
MKTIDAKAFWSAVGQRALGAAVVTARNSAGPAGFLALSSAHVCADPPTMLVSIDKRTSALAAILESRHFAINYLAEDQGGIAAAFAGKTDRKGADRFTGAGWSTLATGAPVLSDASGAIDCALQETIERHGVVIALGSVMDFAVSSRAPLVFLRGKYVGLAAE